MQVQKTRVVMSLNWLFSRTQNSATVSQNKTCQIDDTFSSIEKARRYCGRKQETKHFRVVEICLLAPLFGAFASEPSSGTSGYCNYNLPPDVDLCAKLR